MMTFARPSLALTRILIAFVVLWLSLTAEVLAQDPPDYTAWSQLSARAQVMIDGDRASTSMLEAVRAEIVTWRTVFLDAQDINASRIATLREQITALGPVPAEGEAEPAAIAAERADLTQRLTDAEAPARRAEAAYREAQGLIGEIDAQIAARQAGALLQLEPAPINPANWPSAVATLLGFAFAVGQEVVTYSLAPAQISALGANLPLVAIFVIVGLVLLTRGRGFVGRWMETHHSPSPTPTARLALFGLSLLHHAMPVIGVWALAYAVQISGMVGFRAAVLVQMAAPMALSFMAAIWLGRQVFPLDETNRPLLRLDEATRATGRRLARVLGAIVGLWLLVGQVAQTENFTSADRLVISFPIVVLAGLMMWQLGRLLAVHVKNSAQLDGARPLMLRMTRALSLAVMALGLLGPILAGVGYFTAGSSFLLPMLFSLSLLAVLGILQRVVTDAYGALTRRSEGLDEALTPTLIGFILVLASLPAFALIWGVRPAQLSDIWAQIVSGFTIGGVTISPRNFLIFAIVFAIGYTATRALQSTLRYNLLPKTQIDQGGQSAILAGTGYVGIFLAALFAITSAGIDLSSLAIVAGALSVGIGFGLQTIVSNFVSGIILLIERPFKEGDWIEVNGQMGYVREISVRSTRIETFDRSDLIVPNADLIAGVVTNMTHSSNTGRLILPVGVAYDSDPQLVMKIMAEVAEAHPMVILKPKPTILMVNFGADALEFEIRAILRDVNFLLSVKSEMNLELLRRFREAGIEIPFAQRDLWLRNPEALAAPKS
jgi:potassium efflux system protein